MKGILTWHSLDESGAVVSTAPTLFERQIDALLESGARIVSLATLPAVPPDDDAVAITFDDGFESFLSAAAPVLKKRGLTATVFVVTGMLGGTNSWDAGSGRAGIPALPLMTRDDVRRAFDAGFDIGGHSVSHRRLSGLSEEVLDVEVRGCAHAIEEITGQVPTTFAFPYGSHDQAAVNFVSRIFPIACTADLGIVRETSSPHALPRVDMYYFRREELLRHWGTSLFTSYLMARKAGRQMRAALSRQQ